jgi:hypothetical protein
MGFNWAFKVLNFTAIRLVGAALVHTDGRTDMTKLTVPFRGNANSPKKKGLENKCVNTKYGLRQLMTRIMRRDA